MSILDEPGEVGGLRRGWGGGVGGGVAAGPRWLSCFPGLSGFLETLASGWRGYRVGAGVGGLRVGCFLSC